MMFVNNSILLRLQVPDRQGVGSPGRVSVRGPTAIDRQCRACDRSRRFAGQKYRERPQLFDGCEALVGLLRQQHVMNDLLAGNTVGLGLAVDLRLDQRGINVARADRVAGDALFGSLQRRNLGQADDADIWSLVRAISEATPNPFNITADPASASARAMRNPMPLVEPVTSETLPARDREPDEPCVFN